MPFAKVTSVELSVGSAGGWRTVSQTTGSVPISDLVPANATGVLLKWTGGATWEWAGLRPVGSTESLVEEIIASSHKMGLVKLSSNFQFEAYRGNTSVELYLEGYSYGNDVVWLSDPTFVAQSSPNTWETEDLSTLCPSATAIMFHMERNYGWYWGIRKNGSTDDRRGVSHVSWGIIGCDSAQKIQFYNDDFGANVARLYIVGYITGNSTFLTNAQDITPAASATWEDVDISDKSGCDIAIVEEYSTSSAKTYGVREDGSAADRRKTGEGKEFLHVDAPSSGIIEAYKADADTYLYLVGWLRSAYHYPSDSVARVSSIRHICKPGFYRMQVGLGDLGFDIDVAEATVRKALDTAKEVDAIQPEPPPTKPPAKPPEVAPTPTPPEPERPKLPSYWGAGPVSQIPGIEEYRDKKRREEAAAPEQPSLWSRITPWKEEAGETFGGEVAERIKSFTGWVGGLFK